MKRPPLRVAVLAHGHPRLSAGGAEIASHALHRAFTAMPEVESLFVACAAGPPPHDGTALAGLKGEPRDLLLHAGPVDGFTIAASDHDALEADLLPALADFRPDVVHLHHVFGFGADLLPRLRRALPEAVIVVTFHEYAALCRSDGQMVKAGTLDLCHQPSPAACHGCFPHEPAGRFVVRERFLKAMLGAADHFVSPSRFLKDRHVAWGLDPDRFSVLPNGLAGADPAPHRPEVAAGTARPVRFGFFGQLNPYKGIDVLLEAVARIPQAHWPEGACLLVAGCHLEKQRPAFQARVEALLAAAGPRVRLHGPYRNEDLPALMATVDWVVVPSVWWENAPVVIQEAFLHRRPVIGSGLGGIAEAVRPGVDGLHARPGDADALAAALRHAMDADGLWARLAAGIRPPVAAEAAARRHVDLYRDILARKAGSALGDDTLARAAEG
ncbi:glycosyltransferase family 4 protein [Chthonobacter rhizosphaerae]|uniref:glycosyltransferase family 4 protein n=1 Tax=Chthonobacter rhizosphaerae TaxID=2735553 RepID=UPI0015EEE72A|nr:glycosyltransferase family 4 protein [Chthonobacter rhizosphaerae]